MQVFTKNIETIQQFWCIYVRFIQKLLNCGNFTLERNKNVFFPNCQLSFLGYLFFSTDLQIPYIDSPLSGSLLIIELFFLSSSLTLVNVISSTPQMKLISKQKLQLLLTKANSQFILIKTPFFTKIFLYSVHINCVQCLEGTVVIKTHPFPL